jgi:hypothetical protein
MLISTQFAGSVQCWQSTSTFSCHIAHNINIWMAHLHTNTAKECHILTFFLVAEALCLLVSLMFYIRNIKHLRSHGENFRHYFVTNILRNIKQKNSLWQLTCMITEIHCMSYLLLCTRLINCISILATPKWQYLPHTFVCFLQITHINDFEMCTTFNVAL